jgi:UDP-N-acetylmuramate--alanine ligase
MNLFLQSDPRPLHFVGIGGAGMSALALIALRRGLAVTGSDAEPSGCADLEAAGARIGAGAAPELAGRARAVIASAAISAAHPDLDRARTLGIPIVARKSALAGLIGSAPCVAIAGTHGKTTTTVMTTEALTAAGFAPTGIAGGRVASWGGNARIASDRLFVVEADEYDQAFLTLVPEVAVITNVEADHLECYGSLDALEAAFVQFASPARRVLIGRDGAGCDRVAARLPGPAVWRFGPEDPGAGSAPALSLEQIALEPGRSRAMVRFPGGSSQGLELAIPGLHNLRNAAAALGVVHDRGGDTAAAASALARFGGVGRRFEWIGEAAGVTIVDDYAHHPTEIRVTLAAARQAFPGRRLVAAFQPHLFTRTALHGDAMGEALAGADLAIVTEIYAAREAPVAGVSGARVARAAESRGGAVVFAPDRATLADRVAALLRPGDVLLTLGAGDITRLGPEVARRLEGG